MKGSKHLFTDHLISKIYFLCLFYSDTKNTFELSSIIQLFQLKNLEQRK